MQQRSETHDVTRSQGAEDVCTEVTSFGDSANRYSMGRTVREEHTELENRHGGAHEHECETSSVRPAAARGRHGSSRTRTSIHSALKPSRQVIFLPSS